LYVFITVGWAIPFGNTIPLAKTLLGLFLWILQIPHDWFALRLINPLITLVDIGIYIFGSWLWTLGLRYFQGRQLLARIGKRSLVIGDVPWVHQLLKNYVSKLFSLSYGIASIEVHGANPEDELLHEYGHRVVRGTLLFLGVPDGRKSQKLKQKENAVILAGKQADGVRNIDVGPEVVVMGSNPEIANKGFTNALILESSDDCFYYRDDSVYYPDKNTEEQKALVEELRESRFSSFERLLASYVFFWALAQKVASFPFLRYQHWKSQSRTKIMTTAAPVAGISTPNWMATQNEKTKSTESLSDDSDPIVFIGVTNKDDEDSYSDRN
jgi:signal transduction histidine kinase